MHLHLHLPARLRLHSPARAVRRHLREEQALVDAVAAAPTVESAHEIAAVLARR